MSDFQSDQFNQNEERSLLDRLLADSRLYKTSKDYKDLLDFVVKLRNFAPFNAMLLQIQKPGLTFAASAKDWATRFERWPKEGARPLIILWPFGPVALVYDVQDTEGRPLPEGVSIFPAVGPIDAAMLESCRTTLAKCGIEWYPIDSGDGHAGSIRVLHRAASNKEYSHYRMCINCNHLPATQFTTVAHELAHLFLGHLGLDLKLNVPHRAWVDDVHRELEAETVAYLVCNRNGVTSESQKYLAEYVDQNTTVEDIDLYQVMRAAGHVESVLGLTIHTKVG